MLPCCATRRRPRSAESWRPLAAGSCRRWRRRMPTTSSRRSRRGSAARRWHPQRPGSRVHSRLRSRCQPRHRRLPGPRQPRPGGARVVIHGHTGAGAMGHRAHCWRLRCGARVHPRALLRLSRIGARQVLRAGTPTSTAWPSSSRTASPSRSCSAAVIATRPGSCTAACSAHPAAPSNTRRRRPS